MSENPKIFENPFKSTFCEMFNCTTRTNWLLGRPQESSLVMPGSIRLCNDCAIGVVKNLPDALLPYVDVEKAFNLLPEAQRDEIFDRLFPSAEPKDVLSNLLETMDKEEVRNLLVEHGYLSDGTLLEDKAPVVTAEPAGGPGGNSTTDPGEPLAVFKCPHCDYEASSIAALNGHIGGKHKVVKQD